MPMQMKRFLDGVSTRLYTCSQERFSVTSLPLSTWQSSFLSDGHFAA